MRFRPNSRRKKTQKAYILDALKSGAKITPITALNSFGCFRLAAVIHELRKEHEIITEEVSNSNGATFAQYSLAGK